MIERSNRGDPSDMIPISVKFLAAALLGGLIVGFFESQQPLTDHPHVYLAATGGAVVTTLTYALLRFVGHRTKRHRSESQSDYVDPNDMIPTSVKYLAAALVGGAIVGFLESQQPPGPERHIYLAMLGGAVVTTLAYSVLRAMDGRRGRGG